MAKRPRALGPDHLGLDHLGLDHPDLVHGCWIWCPKMVPFFEVVPEGLVMGTHVGPTRAQFGPTGPLGSNLGPLGPFLGPLGPFWAL